MIEVGVIGCGYWGTKLLRNLAMVDRCRITAVAELRHDRLHAAAAAYPGVLGFGSASDMLALPELAAVVIATPPDTHHELALAALERSLHVLVEKPMATRADAAHDLIRAASRRDRVLMVDHTFLFTRAVTEMKEVLASGAIGEPRRVRAARRNQEGPRHASNLLWDLSAHDVAILDHVLGRTPREVLVSTGPDPGRPELRLQLFYADGLEADLIASWFAAERQRSLEVEGSRARLVYDGATPAGRLALADQSAAAERPPAAPLGDGQAQREPLLEMVEHFVDCIRHETVPRSDSGSGLRVTQVLEAALRSWSSGRRCAV